MSSKFDVWQKIVDVQMHFNDLEMRIRNFGLTVLSAAFAGSGIAFLQDKGVDVGLAQSIPLHAAILLVGTVVWLLFWFMERFWYHRLLMGAVYAGLEIEQEMKSEDPSVVSLAQHISQRSPVWFLGRKLHSEGKIDLFYWAITVVNLTLIVASISPGRAIPVLIFSTIILCAVLFIFAKDPSEGQP